MNNLQDQGRACYKRGEYQKAIELFDRAIGPVPSVKLLDNRAACYEKLNDLSPALKDAKKAIQLHREDATGYLRAGKVLVKMDKESVALEIYTHGLKCIKHIGQGYDLLRKAYKELMDRLSPPKSVDPLTVLPRELAEQILEFISFRQRMNACLVSKQWSQFIRSCPNLWKHLDLSGARKKVRNAFISCAINVARSSLKAATLSNLYDFDKAVAALIKFCPLDELTLMNCGLQGRNLTQALTKARHLKSLKLSADTILQPSELRHLVQSVSESIESFQCTLNLGGTPSLPNLPCKNLTTLAVTMQTGTAVPVLLQNLHQRLPNLKSLTLYQRQTSLLDRAGEHIDLVDCTHLRRLDLSVALQSATLLRLPESLITLRLAPLLVSHGATFFQPLLTTESIRFYLPHLEDITLEISEMPIYDLACMLGEKDRQGVESAGEPPPPSKLRKLSVKGVDSVLQSILELFKHPRLATLEQLSLLEVQKCSDDAVIGTLDLLPGLRLLDLSGSDITGISVKKAAKMEHLKYLGLNDCRQLGSDAVDWARSQGISVQYRMNDIAVGGRKVRYLDNVPGI